MIERMVQAGREGCTSRDLSNEVSIPSLRPGRGRLPETRPGSSRPPRRLPPEVLTDAEVSALMNACGRFTPTGIRDRALIALLYRTGLRINEALHLYPKDLDLEGGSIRVLNGKGGKSRTVGVDPGAAAVIERWLEARLRSLALSLPECQYMPLYKMESPYGAHGNPVVSRETFGRQPLFCTLRGNAMSDAYVRRLLKRLAAKAGIDKRVHAHRLRHTHAAQLRAEGVDIAIISRQLGHASITTTARYLDHLAPRAVIEAMRNRTWTEA